MKHQFMILLFLLGSMATASSPAQAASANLAIRIGNLSPAGGILRLGVYNEASYPDDNSKPVASADLVVSGREMSVVLHGIQPGEYAIEALQDVNRDGEMDTSLLGLPEEPFGFSRDVQPTLAKPTFSRVKFTVVAGENSQTLHLQDGISLFH